MNGMKLYMALAVWMFAAPAWATCGVGGFSPPGIGGRNIAAVGGEGRYLPRQKRRFTF